MPPKPYLIIIVALFLATAVRAQDNPSTVDKIINFPTSFFNKVQNKYSTMEDRLTKQTEKYLQKLAKREKKLKRKMAKVDSTKAEQLFGN